MRSILLSLLMSLISIASPGQSAGERAREANDVMMNGTWAADVEGESLKMYFKRGSSSHMSFPIPLSDLAGLSAAQIRGGASSPVTFELRRDAGTFSMTGHFLDGEGSGHFRFAPNRRFLDELRAAGIDVDDSEHGDEEKDLYSLAALNISRKLAADYQSLGLTGIDLDELVAMRIHGATPEFFREMKALGHGDLSSDDAVSMRIHGATPEFFREMKALGYGELSSDDAVSMRIHGATPQYVKEMNAHGIRPDADELVAMRIHGVTPQFVRAMRDYGYEKLDADDLVSMRIHGVSVEYIEDLKSLSYTNIDADDLVSMRIHGVTIKFIRELKDAGYDRVPVEKLIEMRIHGIDAIFIKGLKRSTNGEQRHE